MNQSQRRRLESIAAKLSTATHAIAIDAALANSSAEIEAVAAQAGVGVAEAYDEIKYMLTVGDAQYTTEVAAMIGEPVENVRNREWVSQYLAQLEG